MTFAYALQVWKDETGKRCHKICMLFLNDALNIGPSDTWTQHPDGRTFKVLAPHGDLKKHLKALRDNHGHHCLNRKRHGTKERLLTRINHNSLLVNDALFTPMHKGNFWHVEASSKACRLSDAQYTRLSKILEDSLLAPLALDRVSDDQVEALPRLKIEIAPSRTTSKAAFSPETFCKVCCAVLFIFVMWEVIAPSSTQS